MVAMGKGGKNTPQRVVELIKEEVSKTSQNATARSIGLPLYSIQKYMAGTAEPTKASLEKLAVYFDVSVAWLRGEGGIGRHRSYKLEIITKDIQGGIDDWDTPRGFAVRELLLQVAALDTSVVIDLVQFIRLEKKLKPVYPFKLDQSGEWEVGIYDSSIFDLKEAILIESE